MSWPPAYVANATKRNPGPVLAELGLQDVIFHRPPMDPESGKRGCFHAHKFMIEQFMATSHPIALFLEDDIVLSPYRDTRACLAELKPGDKEWDMLLLGYGFNTSKNLKLKPLRPGGLFKVTKFWGTHAYALTQPGAKKLHALLEWRGDGIDSQISDNSARLNIYALNPSVMYQSAGASTILPKNLSKAREILFSHNNGITMHRINEVCTVFALPITVGLVCVLSLAVALYCRRRLK